MKRKIVAVATAISMGVLAGCSKDSDNPSKDNDTYRPEINDNPNVYGPPEDKEPETTLKGELKPEENENPLVYGPPDEAVIEDNFNPEDNENEEVYGPPDEM